MPETIRFKAARKNRMVDNALCRAVEQLYEIYYTCLREHPELAHTLEDIMCKISTSRFLLRQYHMRCWGARLKGFQNIYDIADLIVTARKDVLEEKELCLAFSSALEALPRMLSSE